MVVDCQKLLTDLFISLHRKPSFKNTKLWIKYASLKQVSVSSCGRPKKRFSVIRCPKLAGNSMTFQSLKYDKWSVWRPSDIESWRNTAEFHITHNHAVGNRCSNKNLTCKSFRRATRWSLEKHSQSRTTARSTRERRVWLNYRWTDHIWNQSRFSWARIKQLPAPRL